MTAAQIARNNHIAAVRENMANIAAALEVLEANTENLPKWNFVGDWQELARQSAEMARFAESAVASLK